MSNIDTLIGRFNKLLIQLQAVNAANEFIDWKRMASSTISSAFPEDDSIYNQFQKIKPYDQFNSKLTVSSAKVSAKIFLDGLVSDLEAGLTQVKVVQTSPAINVHNNINQSNNQRVEVEQKVKQEVDIRMKFIIEAFREELTGRQLKELQEIQESSDKSEIKKQRLIDKIKSFGIDVAAGMAGGILANPDFLFQLTH